MSISNKDLRTDIKYSSSKDDSKGRSFRKYLAKKNYTWFGKVVSSFQLGSETYSPNMLYTTYAISVNTVIST